MKFLQGKEIGSTAASAIRSALAWWSRELAWFVPDALSRSQSVRLEARRDGDNFRLILARPPAVLRNGWLYQKGTVQHEFLSVAERQRYAVWLIPPVESILSRRVQVPSSAVARFEKLLGLEIDRWSPYGLDEVYVAWKDVGGENEARHDIELRLIPRRIVDEWVHDLIVAQLPPTVLILGDDRSYRVDLQKRAGLPRNSRTIALTVAASLALIFLVVDWTAAKKDVKAWQERYRTEVKSLSEQRNLEERISRNIAVIEQAGNSNSKGNLLARVSSVLPDTDWLTEVAIRYENMTLRGYTSDLDRLIRLIEPIAENRTVSLQGELAYDNSTNRHRFTVVFHPNGE